LLEPDESVRDAFVTLLRGRGWALETASDAHGLEELLENRQVSAVISEASLPGFPALDVLKVSAPRRVPVIFTGYDLPAQDAVDLIRQGAYNYLEKPFRQKRLMELLSQLAHEH